MTRLRDLAGRQIAWQRPIGSNGALVPTRRKTMPRLITSFVLGAIITIILACSDASAQTQKPLLML